MDLRSAFFASSNAKRSKIELELNGETRTLELRDPSLAMRRKILNYAKDDKDQVGGMQLAAVWTVIACLYDPTTGLPVFKKDDAALLTGDENDTRPEARACARLVQQVAMAAAPLLSLGADVDPMEEAEKNSKTTPSAP